LLFSACLQAFVRLVIAFCGLHGQKNGYQCAKILICREQKALCGTVFSAWRDRNIGIHKKMDDFRKLPIFL
jgi:hypothetical protein